MSRSYVRVAVICAAMAGCKKSADQKPADTQPVVGPTQSQGPGKEPTVSELGGPRDTLVLAYQVDFGSLVSVVMQSHHDVGLLSNMQLGPVDADLDCRLEYRPEVFSSWQFDAQQLVATVKMRDDIKWYDGTPVTARDLKFTWDLIRDPLVASPRVSHIVRMKKGTPTVVDDTTAKFEFTQAYDKTTMIAHFTSLALVPHHILKDADRATLRGHEQSRMPMTYGPWKIAKRDPGTRLVLEPNDKFTGPEKWKPRLRRVIFKIIPEYATRLVELENGSADWAESILPADADRIRRDHPEIAIHRRGWRIQEYIGWNLFDAADYKAKKGKAGEKLDWKKVKPHRLWSDKRVRRALTKAINIDKMMKDLTSSKVTGETFARRAVGTVPPSLCDAHNNDIKPLPFDAKAARAELEALGWKDSDGDGILDRDGTKFSFVLSTNSGNPRRAKAAIIIQSNLKAIGVEVQIDKMEGNTFFERLRKKDFDATLSGWAAGLFVDMSTFWHSGEKYEFNFTGYDNPAVDALIEKALAEPDTAKNNAMWRQVQALVYEDQPYTFLYWLDELVALHKRFKDAKIDELSTLRQLNTWWVPANEVKYAK